MSHVLSPARRAAGALPVAILTLVAQASFAQSAAPPTGAASAPAAQLPAVNVLGNYLNAVGTSDAASAGTVTSTLIQNRPTLRPAEVLEFVPGVIVTQHSGDGKANQYFLRGFNLDHGTDFATHVDGMPINAPTHAHGQGYSDLNWLIPELVSRIRYRKGPYAAEDGDFASAGSARIDLFDALPRGIASVTLGQDRYARALIANSNALAGGNLLYAFEGAHNDGPWQEPERFRRGNGLLRWSTGSDADRVSVTAMGYHARWNSTDQIPRRAVDDGSLDRFGTVDRTDGGETSRASLSLDGRRQAGNGEWRFNAYAVRSRLQLFSNFTYFLERPADGDQFEQFEKRTTVGGALARSWNARLGGADSVFTLGVQARHDRLDPVGLYDTVARTRTATTQDSRVRQTALSLWGESSVQWTPWLRTVAGLRGDRHTFDVESSIAANGGERSASLGSPKLSLVLGPWAKTEAFVNAGYGFHSNDARGTTATVAAKTGAPIDPVTPLVRTRGSEIGFRTELVPGLQSSLALWRLSLRSELLFVGDAGETEATRPSRRRGIEWNNHWQPMPWLLVDADLALSRARFSDEDPAGNRVPGAIDRVASLGVAVTDIGRWSGQFQLRYFGPRALIEDNSQRSASTTLAYLRLGYRLTKDIKLAVDVFNVFDRTASDIDYFYTSRLQGEPAAGVDDVHFHPVEPRRVRISMTAAF